MEKALRIELLEKKSQVEQARDQLKSEFVGMDQTIDSIIDKLGSWHNFSHLQQQPRVINIWGAADSGKFSLVKRLIQLLDLSKDTAITSAFKEEEESSDALVTIIRDFHFPNSEEANQKLHNKLWNIISKADQYTKQPLIFVLGNVNSIYLNTNAKGITSSISTDKLRELLHLYFTKEQIALLGEHHVITPSLTSDEVNQLIAKRIVGIHDLFLKTYGISFHFDVTVPVFVFRQFFNRNTTASLSVTGLIQKYVLHFTNEVLTEAAIQNIVFDEIQVREDGGYMIADYVRNNKTVYQFKYKFTNSKPAPKQITAQAPEISFSKRALRNTPKLDKVRLSA